MNIDMQSPEIQKLKKENYAEYRRKYNNNRLHSKEWYCDICKNGKKLYNERKMVTFRD